MNGRNVIVSVKGVHNHPVIIKRNNNSAQSKRRENRLLLKREMQSHIIKEESTTDAEFLLMENEMNVDESNI